MSTQGTELKTVDFRERWKHVPSIVHLKIGDRCIVGVDTAQKRPHDGDRCVVELLPGTYAVWRMSWAFDGRYFYKPDALFQPDFLRLKFRWKKIKREAFLDISVGRLMYSYHAHDYDVTL